MVRPRRSVNIKDGDFYEYLRKSRKDLLREKWGEGETLTRHEADLDELAARDGYPVKGKFKEVVSGDSIAERKEFQKLMKLVEERKVTGVIVHAVDRLGRGSIDEYGWVIATLQRTRTLVVTPGKVYDPTDPTDYMALVIAMIISEAELAEQKRRYREGRNRSSKGGEHIASAPPYGYDKVMDGRSHTLKPNDKADTVRMVYREVASGTQVGTMASKLNHEGIRTARGKLWQPSVLRRLIENPVYKGMIQWGATRMEVVDKEGFEKKWRQLPQEEEDIIRVEGLHDGLVSEELWQAANDAIVLSTRNRHDRQLRNPLAGILRCAKCGCAVVYQPIGWNSRSKTNRYKHRCYQDCDGWLPCDADDLMEMVVDSLLSLADDIELRVESGEEEARRREEELAALTAELSAAERQAERLIDLYTAEPPAITMEAFRRRNAVLEEQMASLRRSIDEICSKDPVDYRVLSMSVREVAEVLKDPDKDAEHKNSTLKRVVKRIDMVNHAKVRLHDDVELHIFLRE